MRMLLVIPSQIIKEPEYEHVLKGTHPILKCSKVMIYFILLKEKAKVYGA